MFRLDNNNEVTIDPPFLLIPEFLAIWRADKTRAKKQARLELSYVYFSCDLRSPLLRVVTDDALHEAICEQILKVDKYKPHQRVKDAMGVYTSMQQTKSLKALKAAENVADQLYIFLRKVDQEKLEDDFDKVYKMLNNLPGVIETLEQARKKVEKELEATSFTDSTGKKLGSREKPRPKEY